MIPSNSRDFAKNVYIIPLWLKELSDNIVDDCINYGFYQSLEDEKNGNYPCNTQTYHFISCFYDTVEEKNKIYG